MEKFIVVSVFVTVVKFTEQNFKVEYLDFDTNPISERSVSLSYFVPLKLLNPVSYNLYSVLFDNPHC